MKWREKRFHSFFFFSWFLFSFFYIFRILPVFHFKLKTQKLKDDFDTMPADDGCVRLDLLTAAGTESVNIKLMGGSIQLLINPWGREGGS